MKKTPSTKSARNLHLLSQMALADDAVEAVKDIAAMDHHIVTNSAALPTIIMWSFGLFEF